MFFLVTGSNDQRGRKAHIIPGPRPAVSNHSGTSKHSNSEFMKFEASSVEHCLEKNDWLFIFVIRHYTCSACFQILNELSLQEIQMN